MSRPRKFRKLECIKDPALAFEYLLRGHWLYHRDKPLHPGWLLSWQCHSLINACRAGHIFYAEPLSKETPHG